MAGLAEGHKVFEAIGLKIPFYAKVTKWNDMVNVQASTVLFLVYTAALANIAVSLTRFSSLFVPIRATIFRCAGDNLRQTIAFPGTVFAAKVIDFVSIATKRFAAYMAGAINRSVTKRVVASQEIFCTFGRTENPFIRDLRRVTFKSTTTELTNQFDFLHSSQDTPTRGRASRELNLGSISMIWPEDFTANRAGYASISGSAFERTKMCFIRSARLQSKCFTAILAFLEKWLMSFCSLNSDGARLASSRPVRNMLSAVYTGLVLAVVVLVVERHICLQLKTLFADAIKALAEGAWLTGKECRKQYMKIAMYCQTIVPQQPELYHITGVNP